MSFIVNEGIIKLAKRLLFLFGILINFIIHDILYDCSVYILFDLDTYINQLLF